MGQLLLSKQAWLMIEIAIIIVLVIIIILQSKKRKEYNERAQINLAKNRNTALEEQLRNPDADIRENSAQQPYDIQYLNNLDQQVSTSGRQQLEVEIHTPENVRRYLFDLNREIVIGTNEKEHTLVLSPADIGNCCCSIVKNNSGVFVYNRNDRNPVTIQRKKKKQRLTNRMVKLESKDIIILGNAKLHIALYDN